MINMRFLLIGVVLFSLTLRAAVEATELPQESAANSPFWLEIRKSLHATSLLEETASVSKNINLLIVPSFNNPIQVSMVQKDYKWKLFYSEWSRKRKTDKVDFPVVCKRAVLVREASAEEIFKSLIKLGFWNASPNDPDALSTDDGAEWLLEVRDTDRGYKAITRVEGGQFKPVYALLMALLQEKTVP